MEYFRKSKCICLCAIPWAHKRRHTYKTTHSEARHNIWCGLTAAFAFAPQLLRKFRYVKFWAKHTLLLQVYQECLTQPHIGTVSAWKLGKAKVMHERPRIYKYTYMCVYVCIFGAYMCLLICRHSKVCYSLEIQINPQRSK